MKNIISLLFLSALLVGCSNQSSDEENLVEANSNSIEVEDSSQKDSSIDANEKPTEVKEPIIELNQSGNIAFNGEVMYSISVTEVVDVTEEARNTLINDTNYLDYASNGQGEQAVKITLLMENHSGEVLGMPYFDNIKVIDSSGITNLGGWKDESGFKTDFGYYSLDGEGYPEDDLYTIQDGETRMATSTVVLATESDKIKFMFDSQKYDDYIDFELPVK